MRYKTIIQLILIGFVIMMFSRCATPKQLIDKADRKDPAAVARYTRDKYPCTDLLKPDTAVIFKDTVVYVDCPDTATSNQYEVIRTDTVKNTVVKTIRVPVHLPVQVQYITRWYEDSAKLKLYDIQVSNLQKDTTRLRNDLSSMTGNRNWYRKGFFIELGLLLILLLLALWKFWKRLTTIKFK